MADQERVCLDQEKYRIQMLFQGMQNVMNAYNTGGSLPPPNVPATAAKSAVVISPQPQISNKSPPGIILCQSGSFSTYTGLGLRFCSD